MKRDYQENDFVQFIDGREGQICGINGGLFFVCFPDNRSDKAVMVTRAEIESGDLSTGLKDTVLATDTDTGYNDNVDNY